MARNESPQERKHRISLERLCKKENLRKIGIDTTQDLLVISRYSFITHNGFGKKCPDLFIRYFDKNWEVIELKASKKRRNKAINQILAGVDYLIENFNADPREIQGRFVVYENQNNYSSELILPMDYIYTRR